MATHLRAVSVLAAVACVAYGLYELRVYKRDLYAWWLLGAGVVCAVVGQLRLAFPAGAAPVAHGAPGGWRRACGLLLAAGGAALWGRATYGLYLNWLAGFDSAWLGWLGGAVLLGAGLDLAWGRWPRPGERAWTTRAVWLVVILLLAAAAYRLGNIADFPGEAAITQIEDLQVGNFGNAYLHGYRKRWEYLSSTWLAALGIWLGGPSQLAMRIPFATVSVLKTLPIFLWLRLSVGAVGATVGTALFVFSRWDVVLSRIPNNHNGLIVAVVFALLAGPVKRGRPSAYVGLGFLCGYVLFEYVAYRPLAVLALIGAVACSLRDPMAGWGARIVRPLITVTLIASMIAPLFLTRIPGIHRREYFDGWNRARGITGYYNPTDTWMTALDRRLDRTEKAAELFVRRGDRSPVRNVGKQPPLIDPVSAVLLIVGIGCAVAHAWRPVLGLTLLGFGVTFVGTLVATGNFDVARVGGAVPYVYALIGFGAAGVFAALSAAWGRVGRGLAAVLLTAAILVAGYWNTAFLLEFWGSEKVRRAHRNNLAYLTGWLRDHAAADEKVLGVAPGYANILAGHDGHWLLGRKLEGTVGWDIESALRAWERNPGKTLLIVFAGPGTPAVVKYLEWLLPGLEFQVDPDPLSMGADVAFARLTGPPPGIAHHLATWHCRGAPGEYQFIGASPDEVTKRFPTVAPVIDRSAWPGKVVRGLYRANPRPTRIRVEFNTSFEVRTGGEYVFYQETYAGSAEVRIDGHLRSPHGGSPMHLESGPHTLDVEGSFVPMARGPMIRVLWKGPDSGGEKEVMPLYRLVPVDPACTEASASNGS